MTKQIHFTDIIKGNLSLPITFWGYGVFSIIIIVLFIRWVLQEAASNGNNYQNLAIVLSSILLLYLIIICIAVWNSSSKSNTLIIWKVLAKVISGLWVINGILGLLVKIFIPQLN